MGAIKHSKQMSFDTHTGLSGDAGLMDLINVFNNDEVDHLKVNIDSRRHQTADVEVKNETGR